MTDLTETPEEAAEFEAVKNETPAPEPKPAPEPAPQPAPAAAAAPVPAKLEPPARMVPHQALHEERVKRQAIERELAELRKGQPPQPAANEEIDENENPLGAISALKAELKAIKDRGAEAQRQQAEGQEIVQRMAPRIEAYAKEHPEYPEQFLFVRQARAQQLALLGNDERAVAMILHQEEMDLARRTLAQDLDPGEVVAKLAATYGWQPKAPDPAADAQPALTPAPAPAPDPAPAAKIDRLTKGHKAAISSSASGGAGAEPDMTLERLAALDGAAFDKAWAANAKRLMQ